jgi:hypothetical protein
MGINQNSYININMIDVLAFVPQGAPFRLEMSNIRAWRIASGGLRARFLAADDPVFVNRRGSIGGCLA